MLLRMTITRFYLFHPRLESATYTIIFIYIIDIIFNLNYNKKK